MLLRLQWVQYKLKRAANFALDCFNAASPAMGLVSYKREIRRPSQQFQCCFACNGFSIALESVQFKIDKVSMLLRLQWVQYAYTWKHTNGNGVSMLLRLQWVQYFVPKILSEGPTKFQCCFACNGFSIRRRFALVCKGPVSMLLRLQWVQYRTQKGRLCELKRFQCCFACNGFSIVQPQS